MALDPRGAAVAVHRFGFGPRTVGLLIFCVAVLAVLTQGALVRVLVPRLGECKLATIAILFGLAPPPVPHCRVLEIGCASGGNLLPMA